METVDVDKLFGPMRPEADDESLLLGGYEAVDPEVLTVMRKLPAEERNLIMEFSPVESMIDLQEYSVDLVVGYHLRDPERLAEVAQNMVTEEIQRVKKYYELLGYLEKIPILAAFKAETGSIELRWILSDEPVNDIVRWIKIGGAVRNLDNILKAAEDPKACEDILHEELKKARASLNSVSLI